MRVCIPTRAAKTLSDALWMLTDDDPARGTSALFPVVVALDNSLWLRVDTARSIPALANADASGLMPMFAEYVIGTEHIAFFGQQALTSRGKRVVVWELLPEELKAQALDLQGIIDAGLLAGPEGGM